MPAPTDAKPLIMGTRSLIAWQQGAKTQTRRLVRPQPDAKDWCLRQLSDGRWRYGAHATEERIYWLAKVRQPYAVGQLLWIREGLVPNDNWIVVYQSDQIRVRFEGGVETLRWGIPPAKWKRRALPAMFMPRFACRYYARVVSVRPERLQDITDEDAEAEGTLVGMRLPTTWYEGKSRSLYADYWDSLHKKASDRWAANPMIWRYELEAADDSTEPPAGE